MEMGGGRLGAAQRERAVEEELGGVGARRQGRRGRVQGGRGGGGRRGGWSMLLGLALIGLRENLYEKGSQEGDGDTDGHFKHTLSIHYYISIQTRECYTF